MEIIAFPLCLAEVYWRQVIIIARKIVCNKKIKNDVNSFRTLSRSYYVVNLITSYLEIIQYALNLNKRSESKLILIVYCEAALKAATSPLTSAKDTCSVICKPR